MDFQFYCKNQIKSVGAKVIEAPWDNREFYSAWLSQTYFFAKDTTRLLMLCGSHLSRDYQSLHTRFIEHVNEERGHEFLLLRDLKTLGFKIEEFAELPITAGFYQSQYYWIQHRSPFAFFGYILALEALGSEYGTLIYKKVQAAFGASATTFLRVHAEEDVDHTKKAYEALNAIPEQALGLVRENFNLCVGFYGSIIQECKPNSARESLTLKPAA